MPKDTWKPAHEKAKEKKRQQQLSALINYDNNPPSFEDAWRNALREIVTWDLDQSRSREDALVLDVSQYGSGPFSGYDKAKETLEYFNIPYDHAVEERTSRRGKTYTHHILTVTGEGIEKMLAVLQPYAADRKHNPEYDSIRCKLEHIDPSFNPEYRIGSGTAQHRSGRTDHPNIGQHESGGRE